MVAEDGLKELLKPDKYGFYRVKMNDGTEVKGWFDSVVKVMAYLSENEAYDFTNRS